eukprot:7464525-Pyramimonas_sp.AAC.1
MGTEFQTWDGALQGGPWAAKVCARGIGDCFEGAQAEYAESGEPTADWCVVELHPEGQEALEIDLSLHSYVDDALRKLVAHPSGDGASSLSRQSLLFNHILAGCLARRNYRLSLSKDESVISFQGLGQQSRKASIKT